MLNHCQNLGKKAGQSGAVLVTGLIFMVVLTIIVISALRSATLEERMAANARNRQIALQAAETALREAEAAIINDLDANFASYQPAGFTAACTNGYCRYAAGSLQPAAAWSDATSIEGATDLGLPEQPRYRVELVGSECAMGAVALPKSLFRITARGVGRDNSFVVLQTMVRKQWNDCSS